MGMGNAGGMRENEWGNVGIGESRESGESGSTPFLADGSVGTCLRGILLSLQNRINASPIRCGSSWW